MYGLITRLTAQSGQREALTELLAGGFGHHPGCLSYVIALDAANADDVWVTEGWIDEAAHRDSLTDPRLKAFAARLWSLVARIDDPVVTSPVSGLAGL